MTASKRHVPLRTCVICGNKAWKSELCRIVATPDGVVEIDSSGKMNGRGAYICGDGSCFAQKGLRRRRLQHALRTEIHDEDWEQLVTALSHVSTPVDCGD